MKKNLACLILLCSLLYACATTTNDPADAFKNESPKQIYLVGKRSLQEGNYTEAIKRFEALDIQYPYDKYTENAQLFVIYAYYMKEDYAMAMAAADHFIRMHPANPHVDYAYYMRGMCDYYRSLGAIERMFAVDVSTRDLTQMQKSFHDFDELVKRFPQSRYAPAAHQYMIYLRNVMADHQLQVAQYYYNRKAYVAAASRAADIVMHYQGAPATVPALQLMQESYQKLGRQKLAQDVEKIRLYNEQTST